MTFLQNKMNGIKKRFRALPYGLFYVRNSNFKITDRLVINGKKQQLQLAGINIDEFSSICLDDCYGLSWLKRELENVKTIVDIGANQGMFLVAARQKFPKASISCYEPNKYLQKILSHNANTLNATVYYEAVTKNDCKVSLNYFDSDLATTIQMSDEGDVEGTSLRKVVGTAGGKIDILKMDCEGAEWVLLEDVESFKNVRAITMEYHLPAKPGMNRNGLEKIFADMHYKIIKHTVLSPEQGLIIAINKEFDRLLMMRKMIKI